MNDWTIFGERLSHIMREYDVSLRELSRRTGITLTTLHRDATSKRVPRATEILKCANALGITIDYLLGLSNDPHLTGKGERIIGKGEPMSDLIDRQAAISAICNACGKIDCDKMDKCEKLQLPPANSSEFPNNSDTISRQAAINKILGQPPELHYPSWYAEQIKELPSAQPEIIRCKDCKHWIPYDWMFSEMWQSKNMADYPEDEIGCDCCDMAMKANDFCSRADRRTE